MNNGQALDETLNHRRAVRVFDPSISFDTDVVERNLKRATLAPSSSNMQLYEFYHVKSKDKIQALVSACLGQSTIETCNELVVFVVRKDLFRSRAKANLDHINEAFKHAEMENKEKKHKMAQNYYGKLMPFVYSEFLGLFGAAKYLAVNSVGLFKPSYREVRKSDMRIVAHKSAGLAAQTFMLGMASEGYDTCPVEGLDSARVKRILGIPYRAEVNMIVSCGTRKDEGIWGERFRVPFKEVYHTV